MAGSTNIGTCELYLERIDSPPDNLLSVEPVRCSSRDERSHILQPEINLNVACDQEGYENRIDIPSTSRRSPVASDDSSDDFWVSSNDDANDDAAEDVLAELTWNEGRVGHMNDQNIYTWHEPNEFYNEEVDTDTMIAHDYMPGEPPEIVYEPGCALRKGMIFDSKEDLKEAIYVDAIRRHHHFSVIKSSPHVLLLKCKMRNSGCNWKLGGRLRVTHGKWEITSYNDNHTCAHSGFTQDHAQLTSQVIANSIRHIISKNPMVSLETLKDHIKQEFSYEPSWSKLMHAKKKAVTMEFGDWDKSYNELPHLMNAMQSTNPGSVFEWQVFDTNHPGRKIFGRVFWSYGPCIEAFELCRPVILIDGTHLYGKYVGKLLIATAPDADNHILPLAFAIVEEESSSSWGWFLKCIHDHVTQKDGICFISDRHAGIAHALQDPNVGWRNSGYTHRYCLRHVVSNFNKIFHDQRLKKLVARAGRTAQPRKWERYMQELNELNNNAPTWFDRARVPREKWTLAYDGFCRWGYTNTNMVEVFNGVLKGARGLPVCALFMRIWYRTVKYFENRRKECQARRMEGHMLTKYALDQFQKWRARAGAHEIIFFNRSSKIAEVITGRRGYQRAKGNNTHRVDLNNRTCTCRKWGVYGIPCSHVQAVLMKYNVDPMPYISFHYFLDNHEKMYNGQFQPIPHKECWSSFQLPELCPNPELKRGKGRPQSSRLRNEMDWREPSNKIRCGLCGFEGHNRKRCPNRDNV